MLVDKLVTGVVVVCNTKDLFKKAYESVRKFHKNMRIIIIDGSDENNPCYKYVTEIGQTDNNVLVIQVNYNIGHGRGMCVGIYYAETPYVLLFDSDIEILKSPVSEMIKMMDKDTFGVGFIEYTGFDGFVYGVPNHHYSEPKIKYLHPYFQLMQVSVYNKFYPYCHHGAPCFLTMNEIHEKGLSDKIIKEFPGLGHTRQGVVREFVKHDVAGTRIARKQVGLSEIEGSWER
jgi:hypothetical protein